MRQAAFALLLILLTPWSALAVNPDEVLADPALEARARVISAELRCMVCQNQSIDDSNAELAKDLRVLVRERLTAGDSDQAVKDYLVSRYGTFVLLKPPLALNTVLLWLMPAGLFAIGGTVLLVQMMRRRQARAALPLSQEEQEKLDALLADRQP